MTYDLLIKDARVVDGSGMPGYTGDVAVQDGRIAELRVSCKHHWQISTPTGSKSIGVCKLCGLQREFGAADQQTVFYLNPAFIQRKCPRKNPSGSAG